MALKLIPDLDSFKSDLIGLVKSIKYKNISNGTQQQIKSDL